MSGITKRQFMAGAAAVSAAGLVGGRGAGAADAAQVLKPQITALNSIDPAHEISAGDEGRVSILVNNALLRYAPGTKFELIPDLATRYEVSEDGKVYTFFLRKDVKWHRNFGPFTARDVKWSVERILNPETKSRNAGQFRDIASVEVVDDHAVRFNLKAPSAVFPHAVATFRAGFLMSEAAAKAQGAEYGTKIVGTGPFYIEKADLGREIVLRRNDEYFGDKPKLDTIAFQVMREESTSMLAFDRGQIDVVDINDKNTIDRYLKNPDVHFLVSDVTTGFYLLTFNTRKAPFDRKEVRQAFQHAIDKKAIVDTVYGVRGQVLDTVVPPGVEGYTTDLKRYDYNPDKAAKMLADAGVRDLAVTLTVPVTYQREAVLLQAQLKKVGVTLNIKQIDRPTWFRMLGQTDHEILWNAAFRAPAADAFLYPSYHSTNIAPNGINCAMYGGVDDLLDKARVTFDAQQRAALYTEALRRIAEDSPAIPLTLEKNTYVAQKWIKGLDNYRVPENTPMLERVFIQK